MPDFLEILTALVAVSSLINNATAVFERLSQRRHRNEADV
jgi:hypothetical protein